MTRKICAAHMAWEKYAQHYERSTMTVASDFAVTSAPGIAAAGVTDIVTKLAPFAFESGMTVTMCAGFPEFGEAVTFTLEFSEKGQSATDAAGFLATVRANEEILADRLAAARYSARSSGLVTVVPMDGITVDPGWPALVLSAGPYNPDDED